MQQGRRIVGPLLWVSLVLAGLGEPAFADSVERTSLHVVVKDAETSQPISQAHITLTFREPGRPLKRAKTYSYSAKTNPQGRCNFSRIPKGTIRLVVTAERHQSFGKEIELDEDNQVIEVKLRKPQPLL